MKPFVTIAIPALLLFGAWVFFTDQSDDRASVYLTAPVARGDVSLSITASGTARAVKTVAVGSQLSGQIDKLYVDFNDPVESGQRLARINQQKYQARQEEAEAALDSARSGVLIQQARLDEARGRLGSEQARSNVFDVQVKRAQITLNAAEADLGRMEQLSTRSGVTRRQLDQARTERDLAEVGLEEARAQQVVHAQKISTWEADLRRTEAELSNARANEAQRASILAQTRVDLERTMIRSPIKGVVIDRSIDSGQTVAASLEAPTLFEIAQNLSDMEVHARIDEADIGRIVTGQEAVFRVDAFPDRLFRGTVRQIRSAPKVFNTVVTYTVVLETPNPDLLLMPGMTAIVRIMVREEKDVLTVPNAALRFDPGSEPTVPNAIWILDEDDTLRPVEATLGLADNGMTAVQGGGLQEGQRVVFGVAPRQDKRQILGLRFGP